MELKQNSVSRSSKWNQVERNMRFFTKKNTCIINVYAKIRLFSVTLIFFLINLNLWLIREL